MLCIIVPRKKWGSTHSLLLLDGIGALSAGLLLRLALLEKGLRDQDLVVGRDTTFIRLVRSPVPQVVWNRAPGRELLQSDILCLANSKR